jgi:alkylhydroperoxidase family enzyme
MRVNEENWPCAAILMVTVTVDGEWLSAHETREALHEAADALVSLPDGRCLQLHTFPAFPEGLDSADGR